MLCEGSDVTPEDGFLRVRVDGRTEGDGGVKRESSVLQSAISHHIEPGFIRPNMLSCPSMVRA